MKSNFILNPDFFTTNLYHVSDEKNSDLNLRGSNQKQLVIVYRTENTPLDEGFLAKILNAVQYDLQQDTTLIELRKNQNFSFKNILKTLSPKYLISLGVSPKNIGVNVSDQLYKPRNIKNCCFLFTDKLSEIAEDKNKKGALWGCLQSMFTTPKNETDA